MEHMYEKRRALLKEHFSKRGIEAGIIMNPANVYYYTGFLSEPYERFMAFVICPGIGAEFLFVPALDLDAAQIEADLEKIVSIADDEDPFVVLKNTIGFIPTRFGIEGKVFSYDRYLNLVKTFSETEVDDVQPFINKQREKKSSVEVERLTEPIKIIERVLLEGIKKVDAGITEAELTAELEFLMRRFGADGPSFSTIVLSGEKSALPHGSPGDRRIEYGDFLLIDFGVMKDGYCSDITRTFVIGEASNKQKEIYDIVLQSNEAGIQAVKAGLPLKSFDLAARKVIQEHGYGQYFNNRVGHGLGIEVHEAPSIHQKNDDIAEKGLVFTIEPGIYIPGEGGVRIEDIVYINEEGKAEVLTSFSKELQIL